jgi:CBS domain-containing protein
MKMKTGFKVCDTMTEKPITVSPETTLQECARIMAKNHVGALIFEDKGKIAGIMTEQDVVRKAVLKGLDPKKTKAREIMEKKVRTIPPEKDIFDAIKKMRDLNIRHLPVSDGKKMIGLLTLKDVLKIEPQLFDLLVEKFEIREEERKPIHHVPEREGICQICGKYSEELIEKEDALMCRKCWREIS